MLYEVITSRKERQSFPSRKWYPVKEEMRIPATYIRYDAPKIVKMPDILGAVLDEEIVITSYSIHYTKLYETTTTCVQISPLGLRPSRDYVPPTLGAPRLGMRWTRRT